MIDYHISVEDAKKDSKGRKYKKIPELKVKKTKRP